jgi:outer membrane lipoprotein SlyB
MLIKASKVRALAIAGVVLATLGVSACTSGVGGNVYSRGDVGNISRVETGTLIGARQVKIEGTQTGVGAATGAVVGGVAGSTIGGGDEERAIGAVVGAVLGGIGGAAVEKGTTGTTGFEFTVRLDSNGETVVILQGADIVIPIGAPVNIVYGDRVRVVPR